MTDEGKNVGTEHWPSKENIVSYFFLLAGCSSFHILKMNKLSCGPWTTLLKMQLQEMLSSFFVSFGASSSSEFADLISTDAGHGGRNDVDDNNHACASNSHFSRCLVS